MNRSISDPVSRRNLLLGIAAVAFLFSVLAGFPVIPLTEGRGLVWMIIIAGGALFAVLGIREFADAFLDNSVHPWYARRGAWPFLFVSLVLVNSLLLSSYSAAFVRFGVGPLCSSPAVFLATLALELCWIVLLDWVSGPTRRKVDSSPPPKPSYHYRPRKPSPRSPWKWPLKSVTYNSFDHTNERAQQSSYRPQRSGSPDQRNYNP